MKNNIVRMQKDKQDYLSEKELQSLIDSIEQEEMVHAPQYLKESILDKIMSEERINASSSPMSDNMNNNMNYNTMNQDMNSNVENDPYSSTVHVNAIEDKKEGK